MKFSIHAHQGELFKELAMEAMHIAVQATKRKEIRNIAGYARVSRKPTATVTPLDRLPSFDVATLACVPLCSARV